MHAAHAVNSVQSCPYKLKNDSGSVTHSVEREIKNSLSGQQMIKK